MKKIIKFVMVTLVTLMVFTSSINAKEKDSGKALSYIETYINNVLKVDNEFEIYITNQEVLYDKNLNEFGYVFELENGHYDGYAIIVKTLDGGYAFQEASLTSESPYKYNSNNLNIYSSILNYYSLPIVSTTSLNNYLDLRTNEYVNKNDIYQMNAPEKSNSIQPVASGSKYYLPSYNRYFTVVKQEDDYSCQPYAFAMAVNYMNNAGKINILTPKYENIITLAEAFYKGEYGMWDEGLGLNSSTKGISAIRSFSRMHCSRFIDCTFSSPNVSSLQLNINNKIPSIVVYNAGAVQRVSHSCTMVGYYTDGDIIVIDPYNKREVITTYETYSGGPIMAVFKLSI